MTITAEQREKLVAAIDELQGSAYQGCSLKENDAVDLILDALGLRWYPIETAPLDEPVLVLDADGDEPGIAYLGPNGDWRSDEGTPIVYPLIAWTKLPCKGRVR